VGLFALSALGILTVGWHPLVALRTRETGIGKRETDKAIKPIGDIDRDFVEMMPHQGAIDMAKAKLNYDSNEQFRRLAQRIAATQQPEITLMRDAVSDGKSSAEQLPEQSRAALRTWVRLAARSTMAE